MAKRQGKSLNDLYAQVSRLIADVPEATKTDRDAGRLTPQQKRADRLIQIYHRYAQNIGNAMNRNEAPLSGNIGTKDAKYGYETYRRATKAGSTT